MTATAMSGDREQYLDAGMPMCPSRSTRRSAQRVRKRYLKAPAAE
jgi:hypothetical protein